MRKIIHVDMDAFYASIEQRDHPEYRGKPLAVGHAAERGVVAAASYEAREWGVHSAMPSLTAMSRCPGLIFVPARFDVYRQVSMSVRKVFLDYTDLVEPLSLDEAYLDVTTNKFRSLSATLIARDIRRRVWRDTALTASAGISVNKFLAKVASDYKKPDGLFVIRPEEAESFAAALGIEQFWGVGRVTAQKMRSLGIRTGSDLRRFSEAELKRLFGKAGSAYYWNARGVDHREVIPERVRKSLGAEITFEADIDDAAELRRRLQEISKEVWERLRERCFTGRTITLKVKYADFREMSRRKTLREAVKKFDAFWRVACELLNAALCASGQKIRLMGLTVSNADDGSVQEYRQTLLDFGDDTPANG
ncbi:MAG: DNA polymerase IV [Synergistaceae bacterium]|jgi:DNA polymerase-4|nr:DNA polymerase IV [Synergistaceae bacterium]